MQRYINGELVDMYLVYITAEGNGQAAEQIYRERYPDKCQPYHCMSVSVQ